MPAPLVAYKVTVYRRDIDSLFLPTGDAGAWIYKVSVQMINAAKANTPVRSTHLRESHRINRAMVGAGFGNQHVTAYRIENVADYAGYVHGGTPDQPDARVYLPPSRIGTRNTHSRHAGKVFARKTYTKTGIKGTIANPWLNDACTRVAMEHGAVPVGL